MNNSCDSCVDLCSIVVVSLSSSGIPKNEMLNPNAEIPREQIIKEKASRRGRDGKKKEPPSNLTPTINTERTTMAHRATVEQRDSAYQVSACPGMGWEGGALLMWISVCAMLRLLQTLSHVQPTQ